MLLPCPTRESYSIPNVLPVALVHGFYTYDVKGFCRIAVSIFLASCFVAFNAQGFERPGVMDLLRDVALPSLGLGEERSRGRVQDLERQQHDARDRAQQRHAPWVLAGLGRVHKLLAFDRVRHQIVPRDHVLLEKRSPGVQQVEHGLFAFASLALDAVHRREPAILMDDGDGRCVRVGICAYEVQKVPATITAAGPSTVRLRRN